MLVGGHGMGGYRLGPRIMGMSSAAQMNFLNGDSSGSAGVLYIGAGCFLSMTDLGPRACHVSLELWTTVCKAAGVIQYAQSSSPIYRLFIAVSFRSISCAIWGTVPRDVSGVYCGVESGLRPAMANLPTRGARTGAEEFRTLKVISLGVHISRSMVGCDYRKAIFGDVLGVIISGGRKSVSG